METEASGVQPEAIAALYQDSQAARRILDYLATRKRNRRIVTVHRIHSVLQREHGDMTRRDVIETFRKLQELGCGEFKLGRAGHPSRFEWRVALITVGQAAMGQATAIDSLPPESPDESSEEPDEEDSETVEHSYVLRPDFVIQLELPIDLTAGEADRLARFITTLPFSS